MGGGGEGGALVSQHKRENHNKTFTVLRVSRGDFATVFVGFKGKKDRTFNPHSECYSSMFRRGTFETE